MPESGEAIEQKERFAVACLAFVLHHDRKFLSDFLRRVCDWAEPETQQDFDVWVEKGNYGDLVLENNKRHVVFVLECKIDAPLKPHQLPDSQSFFTEGYGCDIVQGYPYTPEEPWKRVYITLEQTDEDRKYPDSALISCKSRHWDALTVSRDSRELLSALVNDLFHAFAELRIHCFAAWNMKTHHMKLADQYFHACAVKELLQNTAALIRNQFVLNAESFDDSELKTTHDSYIGRALVRKNAPNEWLDFTGSKHERPGHHLGWYGYAWGRAHVGFYVKGSTKHSALKLLKAVAKTGEEETGEDGDYVWISSVGNHPDDQGWFLSVFARITAGLGR